MIITKKKVRVFKKLDGGVMYSWPSSKYQGIKDFEGVIFPDITKGLEYIDLYEDELPSEEGRDWYHHGPLIMDGDCSKENLKFDEKWEHHLMPALTVKKKHIKKLEKEYDDELNKKVPDTLLALKLQRKIQICKDTRASSEGHDSFFWLEIAQSNLDSHVKSGGTDKPQIRKLLKAKLQELKSKKEKS